MSENYSGGGWIFLTRAVHDISAYFECR